ncbi:MAG: ABC transporter permease [Alphaproteobacteria bacterium]|nr:ABC transporter permease [Alphaproteobacteria bacterium]MDP6588866.1 ABC transporter permease [Alphaproteobacteria bacterium]MDP6818003.1 ABC transporter permease [Alphaproteobacteria bacterium]
MELHGYGPLLVDGAWLTLRVAFASLALGLVFGIIGATAKLSNSVILRGAATGYTAIVRGLPELVLLLIIFYGGTQLVQDIWRGLGNESHVDIKPFIAGTFTLAFVFGAYATEVFRGAILAVPKGQVEAAYAVGMGRLQMFHRVMLPQVWRFALPGLGNLWLVLLKDTSLISVINLNELMYASRAAAGKTHEPFKFYLAAAIIYLAFTIVSMIVLQYSERRSQRGVRMG